MRQVDDAAVLAHRQMLGVRNTPEVPVVPFGLSARYAIAVFLQHMLVCGVSMGAFPAAEFREVAAQSLRPLIARRTADAAAGEVRLARMNGRIVDLLGSLPTAAGNVIFLELVRVKPRIIDSCMVDMGPAVRHPVGNELAHAGRILDPDCDGVPQPPGLLALSDRRASVGRDLQQAVEGAPFVIPKLAKDRS